MLFLGRTWAGLRRAAGTRTSASRQPLPPPSSCWARRASWPPAHLRPAPSPFFPGSPGCTLLEAQCLVVPGWMSQGHSPSAKHSARIPPNPRSYPCHPPCHFPSPGLSISSPKQLESNHFPSQLPAPPLRCRLCEYSGLVRPADQEMVAMEKIVCYGSPGKGSTPCHTGPCREAPGPVRRQRERG